MNGRDIQEAVDRILSAIPEDPSDSIGRSSLANRSDVAEIREVLASEFRQFNDRPEEINPRDKAPSWWPHVHAMRGKEIKQITCYMGGFDIKFTDDTGIHVDIEHRNVIPWIRVPRITENGVG